MWVASDSVVWADGEVVDCEGGRVHVRSHDGRSLVISLQDQPPHLMNPAILVGANDLTSLSYLHEPAGINRIVSYYKIDNNYYLAPKKVTELILAHHIVALPTLVLNWTFPKVSSEKRPIS